MLIKQRLSILYTFILLFSIILAACRPFSPPVVTRVDPVQPVDQSPVIEIPTPLSETPTDTPETAPALGEYTDQNFGFSLSVPEGFEVQYTHIHSMVFLAPQGSQGHRERGFLNVELAGDLTAEWLAKRMMAENATLVGLPITSTITTIDGQAAYVLGRLPGQDLNRQVFVVYKGFLYLLRFMPDDPQQGESYQQMEALYSEVINSFRFLPDRREVPPVISTSIMSYQLEQALEARREDDVMRMLGEEFRVLIWMDTGAILEDYERNEAAQVIMAEHIAPSPALDFQLAAGWPEVEGDPEVFPRFFVGPAFPVLVQGWGPSGSDEAVVIFGRRADGSLFWRGLIVSDEPFVQ
jgi:hypothetical protein